MNKFILLFLLIVPVTGFSQKIQENKVDEFTKNKVVRTSWEKLQQGLKGTVFIRVSKINDHYILGLKMMLPGSYHSSIFSISQGSDFMFKLSNDEVVTIKSIESATAGLGDGARGFTGSSAWGVNISYGLSDAIVDKLSSADIEKIRIYTNDGYVEYPLGTKKSNIVNKSMSLIKENS